MGESKDKINIRLETTEDLQINSKNMVAEENNHQVTGCEPIKMGHQMNHEE